MHDAAHIMMTLGITTNAWLIRFEKSLKKFYGKYQDLTDIHERLVKVTVKIYSQDNLYLTYRRIQVAFVIYMDLSLGFVDTLTDCLL